MFANARRLTFAAKDSLDEAGLGVGDVPDVSRTCPCSASGFTGTEVGACFVGILANGFSGDRRLSALSGRCGCLSGGRGINRSIVRLP